MEPFLGPGFHPAEVVLRTGEEHSEARFLADRMLGKLARYLRILGYDVAYPAPCSDALLIAQARRENRVLLTRDRGIMGALASYSGHPEVVEIRSPSVLQQIDQMVSEGWIDRARSPRCPLCNQALKEMPYWEARHLTPPFTHATQLSFLHCGPCNLILWEGSHWDLFRHRLGRLLGGAR